MKLKTLHEAGIKLPVIILDLEAIRIRKNTMHFKLITFSNKSCTVGNWYHGDELICHTMEKPWLQNKNDISCVPAGLYDLLPRVSPKQGKTYYLSNPKLNVTLDTPGTRTYIQLDVANKQSELLGCIALGESFDVWSSEQVVTNSADAKKYLMEMLAGGNHTLEIKRY